ncbi:MAG: cobalamin-binding protein [Gammaproteobacteria bacterium]|nr:cobalamin-binding protein [Gammaproteobacteria bacterium]NND36149.1 cobalamin-binding protein [Gammaproteobacteria bacterium]
MCAVVALLLAGCDARVEDNSGAHPPVRRIVALSPHLTELVYAAGAGERLVGVVEYSDFPPPALALPRIGDSFRLDYEALAELEPDLILAWRSGTPADVQQRLRDMGFRVVALDADKLDEIAAQLTEIGRLAGTEAAASAVAADYSRRLRELRERFAGAEVIDVFYQVSAQPLFTIGGRHVISESIETCGGRNIFADVDGLSPAVSLESVIDAAPDAIVAGHDLVSGDGRTQLIDQWAQWSSIPAVRNGDLYVVDANRMHRSTVRILDTLEELCGHLALARSR